LPTRAKQLKERRVLQLGELVIATGADATDAETLAGALLDIAGNSDADAKGELAQARRGILSRHRTQTRRSSSTPIGRRSRA
jgi:hypothetical protein